MTFAALLSHLVFAGALALLSAGVVRLTIAIKIMDLPGERSLHSVPTPRGGGLGVVAALLAGLAVLYFTARYGRISDPYFLGAIAGLVTIAGVSLADDAFDFGFGWKLLAQAMAAMVAIGAGLVLDVLNLPGIGPVPLGWFAIPFTFGWILYLTNAMNFIDGLNGLCAGTAAIAGLALALLAAGVGGNFVYFGGLLLVAGCLGFLPFNFPAARIFLGDVGSQSIGYWLAILAVAAARFETTQVSFFLVPLLLAAPIFDVGFTLLRRLRAGEKLSQAHRGHLYQVLQRSGWSATRVTLAHWGFAVLHAVVGFRFLTAPPLGKLWLVLAVLAGQLTWAWFVARRARAAGITRW
jgi:UDP-GlcNAc:undecaprenyl-phosphate GlcNAc-1-phosphate transferase